jgi:DNA-binding MarR family transcriptional regulator
MTRDLKELTNIPVLMNALLANLNNLAAAELARIGVTMQSARALIMLRQHAELRCSVLSRLLGLEAATLSHLLRAMSDDRLIVRNRVANDNRAVVVRLTTKGKRVASACYDQALAGERALVNGLGAKELQLFEEVLARMGDNVTPADRRVDVGALRSSRKARPARGRIGSGGRKTLRRVALT